QLAFHLWPLLPPKFSYLIIILCSTTNLQAKCKRMFKSFSPHFLLRKKGSFFSEKIKKEAKTCFF
nr:hypothetical protein [Lactobacillus amylovorus]